jgi:hypothetical protein|tara:strand:- start:129 stop:629 length:501 start_codon:yes stop_codon:yes gene_type:complete
MISRYFLLLLILPTAFAFTVSPSTVEYEFSPGGEYLGRVCIVGGEDKSFNLTLDNKDIISDIDFEDTFTPSKNYDCQNYTFSTNYFVDEQKVYDAYVYVSESDPQGLTEEEGIVFFTRIGQRLVIDATEAPLNEDIPEMGFTFASVGLGVFIVAVLALLFIRRKRN